MTAERIRRVLMVALILAMPITFVMQIGGHDSNIAASDILLPAGACFLLWRAVKGQLRLSSFALFCFNVFAIVLSIALNFDDSLAAKGMTGIGVEVFKIVALWYQFYVIVNGIDTRDDFLLALRTWVAGSVPISLIGIYGALSYQMTGVVNDYALMFRAQGTLGDSNLFAGYLALSILLGAVLWQMDRSWRKWVALEMAINVAGIFFSASRGTMLSFTVVLTVLIGISLSWKQRLIAGISVAAFVAGAGTVLAKTDWLESNPFTERLATATVNVNDDAASDRKALWVSAAARFEGSPVYGIGRGNFRPLDEPDPTKTGAVHDMFLGIACETGIIGVLAYALSVSRYAIEMGMDRLAARRRFPAATRIILCCLLILMMCGLTISLENFRGLWMLIGLLEAYRRLYGSYGLLKGAA
jgi:hypothetical protein